jgi:hypothetical protein
VSRAAAAGMARTTDLPFCREPRAAFYLPPPVALSYTFTMATKKKAEKVRGEDRAPKPRVTSKGASVSSRDRAVSPLRSSVRPKARKASPSKVKKATARIASEGASPAPKARVGARKARPKARAKKAGSPKGRPASPSRSAGVVPRRGAAAASRRRPAAASPGEDVIEGPQAPGPEPDLDEEDAIRSAKYTPRDLPPRRFEEERFLFPETYGVNRVRLLVRDPEWLFAYWDVNPATMQELRKTLGERTVALSRLTLRITDPVRGGSSDILLTVGSRWWYVRADSTSRTYQAELGLTLPSGEFRRLAESNLVVTPRVGPSALRAQRRVSYGRAGEIIMGSAVEEDAPAQSAMAGPWRGRSIDGTTESPLPDDAAGPELERGGASDVYRR